MSDPLDYTIGWICTLYTEHAAAFAFLDEQHDRSKYPLNDLNRYILGRIGRHNVAIALSPDDEYGAQSAAMVARNMTRSFPNIRVALMVGIAGGVPSRKHDIRLGDIAVSSSRGGPSGVIQYDFGTQNHDQPFQFLGFPIQAPPLLRATVDGLRVHYEKYGNQLEKAINDAFKAKPRLRKMYSRPNQSSDRLYLSAVVHPETENVACDDFCGQELSKLVSRTERPAIVGNPVVHYGLIASANRDVTDAILRDHAAAAEVLCLEIETAGLMIHFPCLFIRGICDYSDSHKNEQWRRYAAMAAAAYAKDVLNQISPLKVEAEKPLNQAFSHLKTQVVP